MRWGKCNAKKCKIGVGGFLQNFYANSALIAEKAEIQEESLEELRRIVTQFEAKLGLPDKPKSTTSKKISLHVELFIPLVLQVLLVNFPSFRGYSSHAPE
jgi:hypothetical protein